MNELHQDKRFRGSPDSLRSAERLERLEVDRAVQLSLQGINAHNVLDVGSGSGVFAEAFARRNLQAAALDVSRDMLAYAKQIVPQVDFCEATMENLPFRDASFDLIFFGAALHESQDLVQTLKEVYRVARLRVAALNGNIEKRRMVPRWNIVFLARIARLAKQAGFIQVELTHEGDDAYRLNKVR
jgi:ubiquinone/menaquinone biosynthesis C-methylase UbiE